MKAKSSMTIRTLWSFLLLAGMAAGMTLAIDTPAEATVYDGGQWQCPSDIPICYEVADNQGGRYFSVHATSGHYYCYTAAWWSSGTPHTLTANTWSGEWFFYTGYSVFADATLTANDCQGHNLFTRVIRAGLYPDYTLN